MMESDVEVLFRDAESLYEEALRDLEAKRLRKAAENAWAARLRATNALILSKMGKMPEYVPETRTMLEELAIKYPEIELLVGRFYTGETFLHGHCFYLGMCPPDAVERRVRETWKYIEDAKKLAGV
ncbi:MAG: hypothetical protein AOA66_0072 [Candidatus Bathyarchaeota archaeon BA2]|nr:MAG: hypothetical protein AOA66_0072 [Candidatus Bathyarchaeota archaeon BA2]